MSGRARATALAVRWRCSEVHVEPHPFSRDVGVVRSGVLEVAQNDDGTATGSGSGCNRGGIRRGRCAAGCQLRSQRVQQQEIRCARQRIFDECEWSSVEAGVGAVQRLQQCVQWLQQRQRLRVRHEGVRNGEEEGRIEELHEKDNRRRRKRRRESWRDVMCCHHSPLIPRIAHHRSSSRWGVHALRPLSAAAHDE